MEWFDLDTTEYAGIDVAVSRTRLVASAIGVVPQADRFLGSRFEVLPRYSPIILPLKRVGLQHDRFTKIQLRQGDTVCLYISQGGKLTWPCAEALSSTVRLVNLFDAVFQVVYLCIRNFFSSYFSFASATLLNDSNHSVRVFSSRLVQRVWEALNILDWENESQGLRTSFQQTIFLL